MSSDRIPSGAPSALPSPASASMAFSLQVVAEVHSGREPTTGEGGRRGCQGSAGYLGAMSNVGAGRAPREEWGPLGPEDGRGAFGPPAHLEAQMPTHWFGPLWVKPSLPPGPWPNEARRLWTLGKGADSPQRLLRGADGAPWRSQAETRVRRDPGASGGSERP